MSADEKAVEEAAKTLRQYLDPMLLEPLSELGLLAKDKIAFWRFKNQVKTLIKAKEIIDQSGIDTSTIRSSISPDLVIPLIESSGDSSDPTLQEMFANLLANAVKNADNGLVHPSYAKALNQMSPLDAHLINLLYKDVKRYEMAYAAGKEIPNLRENTPIYRQLIFDIEEALEVTGQSKEVITISFQNIRRLGVCDQGVEVLNFMNRKEFLAFTDYGYSLAQQCIALKELKFPRFFIPPP
jgi:hypothetical protein